MDDGAFCFQFVVFMNGREKRCRELGDGGMMKAVEWAERHDLGIGGGYTLVSMPSGFFAKYRFGLCTVEDGPAYVSTKNAQDLWEWLDSYFRTSSVELWGGFWRYFRDPLADYPPP